METFYSFTGYTDENDKLIVVPTEQFEELSYKPLYKNVTACPNISIAKIVFEVDFKHWLSYKRK